VLRKKHLSTDKSLNNIYKANADHQKPTVKEKQLANVEDRKRTKPPTMIIEGKTDMVVYV